MINALWKKGIKNDAKNLVRISSLMYGVLHYQLKLNIPNQPIHTNRNRLTKPNPNTPTNQTKGTRRNCTRLKFATAKLSTALDQDMRTLHPTISTSQISIKHQLDTSKPYTYLTVHVGTLHGYKSIRQNTYGTRNVHILNLTRENSTPASLP